MESIHLTVSLAINWILFLALFPVTFVWLRRAFRIIVQRDYSEVALKGGEPPPDPERWAPYTAAINLVAGAVTAYVIYGVIVLALSFDTWTAIAGTTIWLKLILDFALSRHAHWRAKQALKAERAQNAPND
ncbi:hypothetical protein [Hydrogenophilus thiooxidans]|uniref:hypothetical protein n=1 Tax=Hydrogenophilus thiooxidans TaxID=2820326 RepID=UPI001C249848|nr:hypothetical protein [Hydrogenophilus thiooxidans]